MIQQGTLLNDKQKELKGKIMEHLMEAMFGQINKSLDILDDQSAVDIIFSCLVMFTREVMLRIIIGTNSLSSLDEVMTNYITFTVMTIKKAIHEYTMNEGVTH